MWILAGARELSLTHSSNLTRCGSFILQGSSKNIYCSAQFIRPRGNLYAVKFAAIPSLNRQFSNTRDQTPLPNHDHETKYAPEFSVSNDEEFRGESIATPLPPEVCLAIKDNILRNAGRQKIKLNYNVYKHEYLLSSRSLYPKHLTHLNWSKNFDTILSGRLHGIPTSDIWARLSVDNESEVCSWIRELRDTDGKMSVSFDAWWTLHRDEAARRWPDICLWLLLNSPVEALTFIQRTVGILSPPVGMIADCLNYLDHFHSHEFEASVYHDTISHCLQPSKWSIVKPSQICIRLFLKHSGLHGIQLALDHVINWRLDLPLVTLLYILDRFLQCDSIIDSLRVLYLIRESRLTPNALSTPEVLQRCARLLALGSRHEGGEIPLQTLREALIDIGVEPDQSMYNALISIALRSEDHELGWSVFQSMKDHDIVPDSYTFLLLLNDALKRSDPERIDSILWHVNQRESMIQHPHLVSKTMHAILVLSRQSADSISEKSDCFHHMLDVYLKAHDPSPLVDLGIIPSPDEDNLHEFITPPSPHALFLIITAYLEMNESPAIAYQLFHRFRELVIEGHDMIAPLTETDHIYNAFLMIFNPDINQLEHCVMIVETMLQPLPETAVLESQGGRPLQQAAPTTQTWTILLLALFRHHQPQTVSRVRELMLSRGVKFADVTWDVIIQGYARMQMVGETAAALKEMQRDNWAFTTHTIHGVSFLHDQELLRTLLQRLDSDEDAESDQPL